jgi:hypothetical protein
VPATGETLHEIGKVGTARAKTWLERTGRVNVHFSRYEVGEAQFLTFDKLDGTTYSFDLGGVLHLESGNVTFYGEIKKVTSEAGQGQMYRDYLAKCYRATSKTGLPFHFIWLTWHPFAVTTWTQLCTGAELRMAVEARKAEFCHTDDVDEALCDQIAERLWLIVLSDRQESLSMSDDMLAAVRGAIVKGVNP